MIDISKGQILIDGLDASSIPCEDARLMFNVIPQDPLLMPGTIRFNMDPFETAKDERRYLTLPLGSEREGMKAVSAIMYFDFELEKAS